MKRLGIVGLLLMLMCSTANAGIYAGAILDVKTRIYGSGKIETKILFGLTESKGKTALFNVAVRNSDISMSSHPLQLLKKSWGARCESSKAWWDSGFEWRTKEGSYTTMIIGHFVGEQEWPWPPPKYHRASTTPAVRLCGVFDHARPKKPAKPKKPERYMRKLAIYEATATAHVKAKHWPHDLHKYKVAGRVERPRDVRWYNKKMITLNLGVITNSKGFVWKLSGKNLGRSKYAYKAEWNDIDDIVTVPVYVPKMRKIEETLERKYHRVRIEAHDEDTFRKLHVDFDVKSARWRTPKPILSHVLGTKDSRILQIAEKEFPNYTDFLHKTTTRKSMEVLVPHGELVRVRIVKEGYYYLRGNFKVMGDMEKIALLSKVGQKVRQDHGHGSRFE